MSVREENEQKNSCSSRGVGLAAAAVGVGIGIGAAIYYFYKKQENETPSNVGSTHRQNWQSEPLHALLYKEDSQYTTLSEHTTTDTSMNDSDMSYSSVINDSYTTINDGISDNDYGNNDFYDTEDSDRSNDNVSHNSNQEEEENDSDLESDEDSHEIDGDITDDDTDSENSDSDDQNSDISVTDDEVMEISDESNQDAEDSYSIISSVRDEVDLSSIEISDTEYSFAEVDDNNPGSNNENSPDGSLGSFEELNENVNLGANDDVWASTYDSLSEVNEWLVFTLITVAFAEFMSGSLDNNQITVPNNTPVAASRRTGLYDKFFKNKLARNEEEKLKAFRERSWSLEECSICFDIMLKDQELMTLPCTHNFHQHCILPWLQEKHTCPNCRLVAE